MYQYGKWLACTLLARSVSIMTSGQALGQPVHGQDSTCGGVLGRDRRRHIGKKFESGRVGRDTVDVRGERTANGVIDD